MGSKFFVHRYFVNMAKHLKKAVKFSNNWLKEVDQNGNKIGDWLIKKDEHSARCRIDDATLTKLGIDKIKQHAVTAKHKSALYKISSTQAKLSSLPVPAEETPDSNDKTDERGTNVSTSSNLADLNEKSVSSKKKSDQSHRSLLSTHSSRRSY